MIDWGRAGALLASIDSKADAVGTDAARVVATSPRFQNKDFPLSPLPLAVAASKVEEHRRTAERYMALLERVLELYAASADVRSEEHTSELQSQSNLVCRLLLEKKKRQ